ncbi:hypothetical protein MGYG_03140 [Paecilomyces variotii No. 5]|uniref:Protein kinase domain-containing protein n=1 Tax=Byssochlamys spectabilis (strain No. 5 / NBRC 109023) TaxID=1356009 RepID=V5G715_BYSSN|nr:hypothetical protein MGYG_03140 [Paecilomyces variotii No. 5]
MNETKSRFLWLDIFDQERPRRNRHLIYFPQTETEWEIKQDLTEKIFDDTITDKDGVYEASGLALVTQTRGPSQSTEAILRIRMQASNEHVPGGYIAFILMEKLPGRNLENFHTFSLKKQDEVRISFLRSIRKLYALGYKHLDPGRRNIMWDNDTKRCFVVGIEDFDYRGKNLKLIPRVVYELWELTSKHDVVIEGESDDPMIPSDYEEIPLEEDE